MKGPPLEVKALLAKARESAALTVETYNRTSTSFPSGAYIDLMMIAWTVAVGGCFGGAPDWTAALPISCHIVFGQQQYP